MRLNTCTKGKKTMRYNKDNPALTKEELIVEYFDKKRSLEDIGLDFDVHQSVVSAWMKRYGLETRRTKKIDLPVEKLQMMIDRGYTIPQMARSFNCSEMTVRKQIKEKGLKR